MMKLQKLKPMQILALLSMLALVFAIWWNRGPLFRQSAHLWVISDDPVRADAIVVLGGGVYARTRVAARLYHQNFAPLVLITQPRLSKKVISAVEVNDVYLTQQLLRASQVPDEAVHLLDTAVNNTFDEALVLAKWAKERNARQFLIPTDLFHTRRAKWVFRRQLEPVNATAWVIAVEDEHFSLDNWWQTKEGPVYFQGEIAKFILYLLRY